jgi:hypothetical protein
MHRVRVNGIRGLTFPFSVSSLSQERNLEKAVAEGYGQITAQHRPAEEEKSGRVVSSMTQVGRKISVVRMEHHSWALTKIFQKWMWMLLLSADQDCDQSWPIAPRWRFPISGRPQVTRQ